jgi:hypothetical protein
LCEEKGIGPPLTDEPSSVPKIKFLYEVDDDHDYHHVRYVLLELTKQGIHVDMPHKLRSEHDRRHSDDDWW